MNGDRPSISDRLKNAQAAKGAGAGKGAGMVTHTVRTADGGTATLRYGRKQAIKLMCVECLGFEGDPADCTAIRCPLYPFRGRTLASRGAK